MIYGEQIKAGEWLQFEDDFVSHEIKNHKQGFRNEGFRKRESVLIKRYMRGYVVLHVHFCLGRVNDLNQGTHYYCAVFERATQEDIWRRFDCDTYQLWKRYCADWDADHMDSAMLIDIRELLEDPERMDNCVLPSIVRLQTLDDCLRGGLHTSYLIQAATSIRPPLSIETTEAPLINEDGEFRSIQVTVETHVGDSKLVDNVIKQRTIW